MAVRSDHFALFVAVFLAPAWRYFGFLRHLAPRGCTENSSNLMGVRLNCWTSPQPDSLNIHQIRWLLGSTEPGRTPTRPGKQLGPGSIQESSCIYTLVQCLFMYECMYVCVYRCIRMSVHVCTCWVMVQMFPAGCFNHIVLGRCAVSTASADYTHMSIYICTYTYKCMYDIHIYIHIHTMTFRLEGSLLMSVRTCTLLDGLSVVCLCVSTYLPVCMYVCMFWKFSKHSLNM